jgi:hypothetical protein
MSFNPDMPQSKQAAIVGNELDSALASAMDNFRDVRGDAMWTDDEVREEAEVIQVLTAVLEKWQHIAPYILDASDVLPQS